MDDEEEGADGHVDEAVCSIAIADLVSGCFVSAVDVEVSVLPEDIRRECIPTLRELPKKPGPDSGDHPEEDSIGHDLNLNISVERVPNQRGVTRWREEDLIKTSHLGV